MKPLFVKKKSCFFRINAITEQFNKLSHTPATQSLPAHYSEFTWMDLAGVPLLPLIWGLELPLAYVSGRCYTDVAVLLYEHCVCTDKQTDVEQTRAEQTRAEQTYSILS